MTWLVERAPASQVFALQWPNPFGIELHVQPTKVTVVFQNFSNILGCGIGHACRETPGFFPDLEEVSPPRWPADVRRSGWHLPAPSSSALNALWLHSPSCFFLYAVSLFWAR